MNSHEEVFALVPWYVNGSLPADEMVLVENHLAACAVCTEAVAHEMQVARRIQPQAGDDERMAELLANRQLHFDGLARKLHRQPAEARRARLFAGAAAACALIALSATLWPRPEENVYLPMTGPVTVTAGPVVQMAFETTATEPQMRVLLLHVGGHLEGSPSEHGIYRVALGEDTDLPAALEYLHAHPAVKWVSVER